MASEKRPAGAGSHRIGHNLRRLRSAAGMSTYDLSRRLGELGWPVQQTGITRIENFGRRVDVDDLLAIAVAVGCSPNRLILPAGQAVSREDVQHGHYVVTEQTRADTADMWRWAAGERPLILRDEDWKPLSEPTGVDEALFQVANQPHHYIDGYDGMPASAFGDFGRAIRSMLAQGYEPAKLREFFDRGITAAWPGK